MLKGKKTGVIILARLDSKRLPGKGLLKVRDKALLQYVVERSNKINGIDQIVLATTARELDDPLEDFAGAHGILSYRGSTNDVAGRVLGTVKRYEFDTFIRINGDSPLIDYGLINKGLEYFASEKYDIVTNVYRRSFPKGMSVEIVSTKTFRDAYSKMKEAEHLEHVTKYFYDNSDTFSLFNIQSHDGSLQDIQLAVDTPEDFARFQWLIDAMNGAHLTFSSKSIIELYRRYETLCEPTK